MIKTDEIHISCNEKEKIDEALKIADEFISKQDLDKKKAIRLSLLVEETIGMVSNLAKDFNALFWMEYDEGQYSVKLTVKTDMDIEKKNDLLSVSSTGKNSLAKGFMGKISDIIENGLLNYDYVVKLNQTYGEGVIDYACMGMTIPGNITPAIPFNKESFTWSLGNYKGALEEASESKEPAKEAWDELEKSIVANIAKDVIVGVKGSKAELTIIL